jgi:hypothetical protein
MKKCSLSLLVLVVLSFLATPTFAADIPDLTGEWKGKAMGFVYTKGKLHHNQSENVLTYVIERQEGRFIFGRKIVTRSVDGGTLDEAMVGIISADGRTFHMADFEAGYAVGEIKNANEVEISYLSDGTSPTDKDMVALVHRLKRSN